MRDQDTLRAALRAKPGAASDAGGIMHTRI